VQTKYQRYHAKRRQTALSLLPAGCWHVATAAVLEIDHVLNDGRHERALYGNAMFISHILRGTRNPLIGPLQVLCGDCHKAKTTKGVY
jgi:hypothetical protein